MPGYRRLLLRTRGESPLNVGTSSGLLVVQVVVCGRNTGRRQNNNPLVHVGLQVIT
jgi:hypothetical protein